MTTSLQKQAWQSALFLPDATAEWNQNDWPPLEGGSRYRHSSVVLDHSDNNKEQTVVVLGGFQEGQGATNSVLLLNLTDPDKQWREGPPMNEKRDELAAVVCNGGVYVMGGYNNERILNCIEKIDANDLLQSSLTTSTTHERHWTTLTCRLSTGRYGCCAVAVHNRYMVVMGGRYWRQTLASVDILDSTNHTLISGPSMTAPRAWCASAVVGHRIFVVGGRNDDNVLDSVEYLDDAMDKTLATVISFSSAWTTHPELVLPNPRAYSCAMVAVGSCLIVAGGSRQTVEVLDTHRNRVWNLPPLGNNRTDCTLVTVANQVAVIGGGCNSTCATLPLLDKNSWCFRQLCEQQRNGWYQFRERIDIRHVHISPFSTSTSAHKRARPDTLRGDEVLDET